MANKLELTWFGKDEPMHIEPRLLIENVELSYAELLVCAVGKKISRINVICPRIYISNRNYRLHSMQPHARTPIRHFLCTNRDLNKILDTKKTV